MAEEQAKPKIKHAKKQNGMTVRQMFLDRMKREGRDKEWYQVVREESARREKEGLPKGFWAASWDAMRRMGYTTPERERELEAEFLANQGKTRLQVQIEKERAEIREERKIETFEEAVRSLPDKSSAKADIDWIKSHPAMGRKARMKNNIDPVLITAEDVLCPPHGAAPSKAAVYALQHWANTPNEFFKQMLGEQKKQVEEGGKNDADMDDLSEVERLLKQVTHERRSGGDLRDFGSAGDGE